MSDDNVQKNVYLFSTVTGSVFYIIIHTLYLTGSFRGQISFAILMKGNDYEGLSYRTSLWTYRYQTYCLPNNGNVLLERTQQRCRKNGKMCLLQYTKHLLSFIDIYM